MFSILSAGTHKHAQEVDGSSILPACFGSFFTFYRWWVLSTHDRQTPDESEISMTDCNNNGCQCSQIREDVTAYLVHRLKGSKKTFNAEFMPVIELMTSGTAPLMGLTEAKNLRGITPENDISAVDMASLVLVELRTRLQMLIEDATDFVIESEECSLAVVGSDDE